MAALPREELTRGWVSDPIFQIPGKPPTTDERVFPGITAEPIGGGESN